MLDFLLENDKDFREDLQARREEILGCTSCTTWLWTRGTKIYYRQDQVCFGEVSKTDDFQADRFFININGYSKKDKHGYLDWIINKSPVSDCFITKDVKEAFDFGLEMNTESPRPRFFFAIYLVRYALWREQEVGVLKSFGVDFVDILPLITNFCIKKEYISIRVDGASESMPLPFSLSYKDYLMDNPNFKDGCFENMKGGFTDYPETSSWDYWVDRGILEFDEEDETWMQDGFFTLRYEGYSNCPEYLETHNLNKIRKSVKNSWGSNVKVIDSNKENVEFILNLMKGK